MAMKMKMANKSGMKKAMKSGMKRRMVGRGEEHSTQVDNSYSFSTEGVSKNSVVRLLHITPL